VKISTGWWRWTTCGHPPALLVRGGQIVNGVAVLSDGIVREVSLSDG